MVNDLRKVRKKEGEKDKKAREKCNFMSFTRLNVCGKHCFLCQPEVFTRVSKWSLAKLECLTILAKFKGLSNDNSI